MTNPLKRLAIAASFLTCFPIIKGPIQAESMESLSVYLPGIGLLISAILCLFALLFDAAHITGLLNAVLLTFIWLGTTGGIHFDGLMDASDGILSHRDPKRMLEIMLDSRVGNFGALAGFAVLLLKVASLTVFNQLSLLQILIVVPSWARFCEAFAIGAFPYLRESGMGKIWHDSIKFPQDVLLAAILPFAATAIAVIYLGWQLSLIASTATVIGGFIASYWINNVLKGHTGDTYGAVVEIAEVAGVLVSAIIVSSRVML